jgi:hypothetical protein
VAIIEFSLNHLFGSTQHNGPTKPLADEQRDFNIEAVVADRPARLSPEDNGTARFLGSRRCAHESEFVA